MRGDFSRRDDEQKKKYSGVLHQQGRVLLDSDWNDQVSIQEYWKEILGRDVIGQNVVAVPASSKDSFKMLEVKRPTASTVSLRLEKGRAWVSGLLLHNDDNSKVRSVPLLLPGSQSSEREAIVLRAWQQEVSAFQDEELLLEKALGGPDTTERIENVYAVYRIPAADKACEDLRAEMSQLAVDKPDTKLKLDVQFQPTTETEIDGSDCPALQAGGYRGLEHNLYRIEMANVTNNLGNEEESKKPFFKWSHMNGGLVGAGIFKDEGNNVKRFIPTKNIEAFRRSGFATLENCYLETYSLHGDTGIWTADFGALVTFDGDTLVIGKIYAGAVPADSSEAAKPRFFRLWSGLRSAKDFKAGFKELRDGIQLHFPNADTAQFLPGDYWTFEVRANAPGEHPHNFEGGASVPHGPVYRNACLGVIDWSQQKPEDQIHDCRKVFDPLVDLDHGCCIEVSPEEDLASAVKQIKQAGGGCLCLMPGKHVVRGVLDFSDTKGVVFKGLGPVCELVVPEDQELEHIFKLENCTETSFQGFSLILTNSTVKSVWEAPNAFKVSIKDTQIVCLSEEQKDFLKETIPFHGRVVNGLELKSNLWLSWKALSVALLTDANIEENWFLFGDVGIFTVGALALRIHRNRFMVVNAMAAKQSGFALKLNPSDPLRTGGLVAGILHSIGRWTGITEENKLQMLVLSTAVQMTAGAQVDLQRNLISAARGLQALVLWDGIVAHNRFVASLYATQTLLVCMDSLFKGNVVGGPLKKPVNVGFHFGGRATEVQIVDNHIQDSAEGVLFEVARPENLLLQAMATARRHNIIEDKRDDKKVAELLQRIIEESKQDLVEAGELLQKEVKRSSFDDKNMGFDISSAAKLLVALSSLPSALLPVENLKIQGNQIQSSWNGIEISGNRAVASYLIADNLLSQSEGAALFLPGDGEEGGQDENKPKDYRKSVIGNKILCKGVAIWSLQNEIRIEGNDIKVFPSHWNVVSWFKSIFELSASWPEVEKILEDESEESFESPVLYKKLLESLQKLSQEEDLVSIVGNKESSWSAHFGILKAGDLAEIPEEINKEIFKTGKDLLSSKILTMMLAAVRGFAVGVWGVSSTVRMNKIEVETHSIPGGLILGSLSGEISENEISAQRVGIFLTEDPEVLKKVAKSKVKERKILYTPVQIAGNRLSVEAAVSDDGEASRFALLIPRILRGDLSITGNHFVGDVHIGANLDFNVDKNVLMAMDLEEIKKNVSAATRKAPAHKRMARTKINLTRLIKPRDRGAQLPHPKILFSSNQTLGGAVSILPFSFTMKSISGNRELTKPKIELVLSDQNELPMVTFTSNQLDAGRRSSFIFGYQVVISGNQSLIESTPGDEEYSLVGMAWKNEYLYAKGNMPEAMEARHG